MMNLDLLIPKDAPKGGSWAWAKITTGYDAGGGRAISVRLDGEDADLEATPVFLCDPEEFHDTGAGTNARTGRTLVQLLDGQVFVYGESGGMPRAGQADIAAGRYADSKNGRALYVPDRPSIRVADGAGGWFDFAPTEGGSTAWRDSITAWKDGPVQGMTFYDTDIGKLMVWSGTAWVTFAPEPTDTGWVNIPLASGYEAGEAGVPQYRLKAGVVFLRGSIQETTGTLSLNTSPGHTIGTLPAGARPVGADVAMLTPPQNPASHQARLFVWTNGTIKVYLSGSGTAAYVSLSGSFPV